MESELHARKGLQGKWVVAATGRPTPQTLSGGAADGGDHTDTASRPTRPIAVVVGIRANRR
jgi:hypothetical protein